MTSINDLLIPVEQLHDSPLELDLDLAPSSLELTDDTYEFPENVTGRIEFKLVGHDVQGLGKLETIAKSVCGRCLCPVRLEVDVPVAAYWLKHQADVDPRDPAGDSIMAEYFKGDYVNYGPQLRELLMATLPANPLCSSDCKGLCPTCGGNLNETECGCPPPDTHSPESAEWKEQLAKIRKLQGN